MTAAPFSPRWLRAHMATLFPAFPKLDVCVAYSGGVDSTALLAALASGPRSRLRLRAVHVNHGLHAGADACGLHCAAFADRLGVPLKVIAVRVPRTRGTSPEAQARDARYAALARELAAGEILLTAHHADDQLETVLLQLLRGAGIAGIAAMPQITRFAGGSLVRPLLARSRAEVLAWASQHKLAWFEDPTNTHQGLDRNYLRHRVLPRIRSRWPACALAVARSARHAAQAQHLLEDVGRVDAEKAADGAALSVPALRALPSERRANALRVWIAAAGLAQPDAKRLAELAGPVLQARADANPSVRWNGVTVRRHSNRLSLESRSVAPPHVELTWAWRSSPQLALPGDLGSVALQPDVRGPIDLDLLPAELAVRWRQGGERLRPRGGAPRRALKRLLQEAQLPPEERARLPLFFDGAQLIAVASFWIDSSIQARLGCARRARIWWHRP